MASAAIETANAYILEFSDNIEKIKKYVKRVQDIRKRKIELKAILCNGMY